jgi:hypothetical protein
MKKTDLGLLAGACAVAAMLAWPALHVRAFNPQPDPPAFGLIGIDPFSTARLNAVCAVGPLPATDIPPGPCDVTLEFHDVTGRVLKQATFRLQPGQAASLDLRSTEAAASRRTEIQPAIPQAGRGFVLATVEVYDNLTGRTIALMNPTQPKSLGLLTPQ